MSETAALDDIDTTTSRAASEYERERVPGQAAADLLG